MLRSWEQLRFIYHKRLERSKLDRQNRSTYSNFRLIALARVAQSFRGLGFAKFDNQKDAQIFTSHVCINSFQLNMAEAKKSPSRTRWGTSDDRTRAPRIGVMSGCERPFHQAGYIGYSFKVAA